MSRAVIMAGWDDVPHLTAEAKAELLASIPPYQRDARSKGVPQLGSGAVYPVAESEISVQPFQIPGFWRRAYALDVGWKTTAALWGAWDTQNNLMYVYSEHYRHEAEPAIHAASIRARGEWIPGVIDPAARGRAQADGQQLFSLYRDLGLQLKSADNAVESGLQEVWNRLSTGLLKVFSNLDNFWKEYRMYRTDEKGRIVKQNDHLMDCLRYLVMSGESVAIRKPIASDLRAVRTSPSEAGY